MRFDGDGRRQVAGGDGGGHFRDGPHLGRQVGGELIDVVGQIFPGAAGAGDLGLAAQLSFDAYLASHGGHLVGEGGQGVDHLVDSVGQLGDFPLGFEHQFALQIADGHRVDHLGDAADLTGQVTGHEVDGVGEVLPRSCHTFHISLAA